MAGYGDTYDVYRALNWTGILYLRADTKDPPPDGFTGYDGRDPSYADMYTWGQDHPGGNLALRLADGIIGIDVDNYRKKTGAKTLAEAEKRLGALPSSYRSTNRNDGVSGIRLFKVPPGTVLRDRIGFPELGLGGIEIIQRHHRYVTAWPSWHPEKRQYRWIDESDGSTMDVPPMPASLPDLPQKWIDELSVTNNGVELGNEVYDVNLAFIDGEPSDKVAQRLSKALADAAGQNRHDDTRDNVLTLLRYGKNGETGVKIALIAVRAAFISAVTADGSRTEYEASEEFKRFVYGERAAKLLGAVVDATNPIAAFFQIGGAATAAAAAKIDEAAFWNAYPELTLCRDYARSVRVGPWAMLGGALTVAAGTIPPHVVLPNLVGDYASANLYVNLVGPSGSIKSQAVAAARAWLQTASPPDPVKPGSGQGVAKCFAYVKTTKNGPVQVGKRWTAVAMIPEVDTLTAAGSMTGSSLWAELRSAWSDERVGHDYADVTKSVVLQPRRYRLCMIVGVQPLRAGPIFDDVDAGTPQRFVWLPVDDPGAPEQRPGAQPPLKLPAWGLEVGEPHRRHRCLLRRRESETRRPARQTRRPRHADGAEDSAGSHRDRRRRRTREAAR